MRKKSLYPYWALIPALLIFTLFTVVPLLASLFFSFTDWNISRFYAPEFRGITNYIALLKDPVFLHSLMNTFIFAICTTILKTVGGLALALLLVRKIRANNVLRTIYYAPCVLSVTVVGVLFRAILSKTGLLNNALEALGAGGLTMDWLAHYGTAFGSVILIESWMWAGFNMFIFISALQAVPKDYYEYASIEGASPWVCFRKITLPLIAPSFTVVITLGISGGLKVFDIIYVVTNGGPGFDTQVLSTYVYRSFSLGLLGESSAGSVILCVIVMLISFLLNRYFVAREVEA